jgi:ATP-dependent DNA ligase
MPRVESRILYLDHVRQQGVRLFAEICKRDGEGIIAKWCRGCYHADGQTTSWLKIKNLDYSQIVGRREVGDTVPHRGGR